MTDRELQKLKRVELLEMLIEQSKEVAELRERLEEAEKKLQSREIAVSRAGNIAEAALMLNGVFDAAQMAAKQYLENIQRLSGQQEAVCRQMEQETRERCDALAQETIDRCTVLEKETQEKCAAMIAEAEKGANERWADISGRLEAFYNAHQGLRELLSLVGDAQTVAGVTAGKDSAEKEEA